MKSFWPNSICNQSKVARRSHAFESAEYENTINDAFFTNLEVKNHLPVDNTRDGFDNEGDKLVMSPYAMDSYFRVASEIAEKVVGGMPEPSTTNHSYDNGLGRRLGSDGLRPMNVPMTV